MFGYFSHLLEQDEMDEIDVGFLVVGHTHCSIDQYFSVVSSYIRNHADFVPTPDAMRYLLTVAHGTESMQPDVRFVQSLDVSFSKTFTPSLHFRYGVKYSISLMLVSIDLGCLRL